MTTLIIGSSGAIGGALMRARPGALGLSRRGDGCDITDEASIIAALARIDGPLTQVIVASGALELDGRGPEKTLRALDPQAMAAQFALNATGPALVLKHVLPRMPRDRRAVFVALSARVGSIGDNRAGGWYAYRAAKAALNQLIHTAAIEAARSHPQAIIAALHPGTVQSELTRKYLGGHPAVTPDEAAQNLWRVIDGLTPADTGGFLDWAGKAVVW
jgi:NAD(P)-dependent dehydrogenase (short-subunit alcohol dehydrogenase family)